MTKTDKLLLAIKIECDRQTKLAEIRCFERLAERSGIPKQNLPTCLNELQDQGYIKFSVDEEFVYITRRGKEYIS